MREFKVRWRDARIEPPVESGDYIVTYFHENNQRWYQYGLVSYSARYKLWNAHDLDYEPEALAEKRAHPFQVDYWMPRLEDPSSDPSPAQPTRTADLADTLDDLADVSELRAETSHMAYHIRMLSNILRQDEDLLICSCRSCPRWHPQGCSSAYNCEDFIDSGYVKQDNMRAVIESKL